MSNTSLTKNRPLKNVFKAPVKSGLVEGSHTSVETMNKVEKKAVVKVSIPTESRVGSLDQSRKKEKTTKERSLTDAEYEEIFSSVLSAASDINPEVEGSEFQKKKVDLVKNKHKLPEIGRDGLNIKKQKTDGYRKFKLTDDSFQTPVFEDLALKKKVKKIKKNKREKAKVQMPQVSTVPAGLKTPPRRKPPIPPISPWGSHFAKFNSQGSSFYKPSDESQSIVESLFEDDESSSSKNEQLSPRKDKVKQTIQLGSKEKALHLSKELQKRLELLHEDRNVGLWVICDNSTCQKQRYMPHVTNPLDLPDKWYCSMNPDPLHNSCEKAEHGPSEDEEEYLILNKYNVGSIVWARVKGYPWWPAIVDDCPDFETYFWLEGSLSPTWYHVVFFDEKVTRAWLKTPDIVPYIGNETAKRFKQTKTNGIDYRARLVAAKQQATDAASLSTYERIKAYSFIARYKKPLGAEIKGKGKYKTEVITKMQVNENIKINKSKYGRETNCFVDIGKASAMLNNSYEENKIKDTKNKHKTLHPALTKQTNNKSNYAENKSNGNAEHESEGIIFSGTMLKELLKPKYINRKTKKRKQKETDKICENENQILGSDNNEEDGDKITQEKENDNTEPNENVKDKINHFILNENFYKPKHTDKTENINNLRQNDSKFNSGVIPQSPNFDASGEIQNEEIGSTEETVSEKMEIVTSTSENQDMFSDQCIGDAVVPTLSQSSLPFECEE